MTVHNSASGRILLPLSSELGRVIVNLLREDRNLRYRLVQRQLRPS